MPTHKKNTLLKNADANAASNFFKSVFFSPTQEEFFPPLFFLFFFRHRTGIVRNRTDSASNVNRFVDSVCGLRTEPLRMNSKPAGNIRLNEIKKRRALFRNRTVVLLINSGALSKFLLLIPSFFYFVNPFFVSGNPMATVQV